MFEWVYRMRIRNILKGEGFASYRDLVTSSYHIIQSIQALRSHSSRQAYLSQLKDDLEFFADNIYEVPVQQMDQLVALTTNDLLILQGLILEDFHREGAAK